MLELNKKNERIRPTQRAGADTGVTSHPLPERENYITKNITSQATLLANERV